MLVLDRSSGPDHPKETSNKNSLKPAIWRKKIAPTSSKIERHRPFSIQEAQDVGKKIIRRYDEHAGGWGVLKALGSHLVAQGVAVKGPITLPTGE
jgi:hypothetical protein